MRKLDDEVIDIGRVPDFGTLVKDCKLLKICATRMRSIAASCSGAIVVLRTDSETLEITIDYDNKT